MASKPITDFHGPNFFLSNFYAASFIYNGRRYSTSEHAYQAAKTLDPREVSQIQNARTAGHAKKMGRAVTLRPGWDGMKLRVMEEIVRAKFLQNPMLREWLEETGDAELIEGNTWGDRFWGKVDGVGENHLGKILMKVRTELRSGLRSKT